MFVLPCGCPTLRGILARMKQQPSQRQRCVRPQGHYVKPPGSIAKVKPCPNGYPLPPGLNPGDVVRIVAFDHGYYTVEKGGRTFSVFLVNVAR